MGKDAAGGARRTGAVRRTRGHQASSRAGARRGWAPTLLGVLLAAAPLAAQEAPAPARASVAGAGETDCAKCHSLPNLGYREAAAGPVRSFTVTPAGVRSSAHGKLTCRQCHADISAYPHPAPGARKRVTCDQDCHAVASAGRPYTHRQETSQLGESVHGARPDPDHPVCLSCHGEGDPHAIAPVSRMSSGAKMALCVRCHDDQSLMKKHDVPVEAVASYRRSFHYKAIRFGDTRTAVCSDCHSAHRVLRPGDPRSTVAAANLTKTCGQAKCHAGARRNFAVSGANHLDLRVSKEPLLWFEEKFFYALTAGTMLMLLVGILLDVQRKFGWLALADRLVRALGRRLAWLRPALARSGRRGVRLARQLLLD